MVGIAGAEVAKESLELVLAAQEREEPGFEGVEVVGLFVPDDVVNGSRAGVWYHVCRTVG